MGGPPPPRSASVPPLVPSAPRLPPSPPTATSQSTRCTTPPATSPSLSPSPPPTPTTSTSPSAPTVALATAPPASAAASRATPTTTVTPRTCSLYLYRAFQKGGGRLIRCNQCGEEESPFWRLLRAGSLCCIFVFLSSRTTTIPSFCSARFVV